MAENNENKTLVCRDFHFQDQQMVQVVDRNGEPWFIAKDIAEILGYATTNRMTERLDEDEKAEAPLPCISFNGVKQKRIVTIINESGLYNAVLGSKKPEAKVFKKWVTSDVLPKIRKTGKYGIPDPMKVFDDPVLLRQALLTYSERLLVSEAENKILKPKAEALDRFANADGLTCVTDAAKALQVRPMDLFSFLSQNHFIYRRVGGKGWVAYQTQIQQGILTHKVVTITDVGTGREKTVEQVLVTAKGLAKLSELLQAKIKNNNRSKHTN